MAEKFIKDEKGIVLYTTTSNLQLEKPLVSDNYDINVHNRNMDKIDEAINEVKGQVDGLELTSTKVIRPNKKTVEESLSANETSISEHGKLINDLKLSVSNGKNLIATAITGKGVSASGNDAFSVLAGKIGGITVESLGGKRWATGSSSFSNIVNYSLDFTPSIIFAIVDTVSYGTIGASIKNISFSNLNEFYFSKGVYYMNYTIKNISNKSFELARTSGNDNFGFSGNIKWYAFE